jgi:hypothetical protein
LTTTISNWVSGLPPTSILVKFCRYGGAASVVDWIYDDYERITAINL